MLDPGGTKSRSAPGMSTVPGSARSIVKREAEAIVAAFRRVRMSVVRAGHAARPPPRVGSPCSRRHCFRTKAL